MKKTILILILLLMAVRTFSQTVAYPKIDMKIAEDLNIKSVITTDYYTQINFLYKNTNLESHYIYLNPPDHEDAFYIKANGINYKLLSTQNIGNLDRNTTATPGESVEFSAKFQKLPAYTTTFDLIEGTSGTWYFYGVQLKLGSKNTEVTKFRRDYNYVALYDPETETWGEWQAGNNTFVININEKGDVSHLKANGDTEIYKRLPANEEGNSDAGGYYQIIKALDKDGEVYRFQFFDNNSIGLKMMWGSFMIQFANL